MWESAQGLLCQQVITQGARCKRERSTAALALADLVQTYKLSYRDLAEMMAERRVDVAHTTIMRWVQR